MLLLSLLLIAFVTYFVWKPFLALERAAAYQQPNATPQELFEQFQNTYQKKTSQQKTRQDQRPQQGYQGGEYIDFEEL